MAGMDYEGTLGIKHINGQMDSIIKSTVITFQVINGLLGI